VVSCSPGCDATTSPSMCEREEVHVPSHRADTPPLSKVRAQRKRRSDRRTTHRAQISSLSVSQVGITSALGVATIALPVTGLMTGPAPMKPVLNEIAAPTVAMPAFPFLQHIPTAVADGRLVADDVVVPVVPQSLVVPRNLFVTRPTRGHERAVLPGCFGEFPLIKADNGRLPNSMLCTLWDGKHQLRADAAVSLAKLNVAYTQRFGHPICISDAYRSISAQYTVKALRGGYAARPGTSRHGRGLAVDFCDGVETFGSATHQWMVENGPAYEWFSPPWAQPGGTLPEAWHLEYWPDGVETSEGEQ
jgi:zinc D-Ala-D-Ala carboxypeptidase